MILCAKSVDVELLDFLIEVYVPNRLNLSARTIEGYQSSYRVFSRWLNRPATLSDLNRQTVLKFLHHLVQNKAPKTVNDRRKDLLALWNFAFDEGLVGEPPRKIPTVKEPVRVVQAWSLEELERLLAVARHLPGYMHDTPVRNADWWTSLILAAYDTAVRKSSLLSVKTSGCDLSSRRLLFGWECDKTNREHWEAISEQTTGAIAKHFSSDRTFVWPFEYTERHFYRLYKPILKEAGLPYDRDAMFHRFRRTNATLVAKHGGRELAQRQLGHTHASMTAKYIDERQLDEPSAIDVLPRPRLNGHERQLELF